MASATEQTKKTARSTKTATESAAKTARVAANEGEQTLRTVVRNSAYATVGAGDLAVSVVRHFNQKAAELRAEAPSQLRTTIDPREVTGRIERGVETLRTEATKEFDRLSERGRTLIESIQRSTSTRKAFDQVGNARSQVKAATTSVRRATKLVGEAAEESVEKVGDDSPVDYSVKNLDELREMARALDIQGRSSMNRDELVSALRKQ